ncbi:MFS transporter [Pseudarthrobacter sp. NPDC092184]|uniref:MFS transporter n=1 Tax=unclassified Pseudarthrobacter TaxID=2647000 RepID=UPI003816FABC
MVFIGILLVALSARLAVAGVSPILSPMGADLPFNAASIGVLGMLPTAGFALMGFLTPQLIRRLPLEHLLLTAVFLAVIGQLSRALGTSVAVFLLFSLLTMIGLGLGNIVLPPLVKKYFPDRVGLLTALYVTLFAVSTAVAPQLAVPIADVAGWRVAVGVWSLVGAAAALPWVILLVRNRAERRAGIGTASDSPTGQRPTIKPWRSPIGWGLALVFAGCSSNTFATFTWLPTVLVDRGMSPGTAGSMLALYAIVGLPTSLVVPWLVGRARQPFPIGVAFTLMFAVGYSGLLLAPAATSPLWMIIAGLGQGTYSFALLMINKRTRTTAGSGALSGFAQGVGYSLACTGPLMFGLLYDISGTWVASFGMLSAWLLALTAGLLMINRPRMLEDGQLYAGSRPQSKP